MIAYQLTRGARLFLLATLGTTGVHVSTARAGQREARAHCTTPQNWARFSEPLPHLTQKLTQGQPALVVALGSSSTAGVGADSPLSTYPAVFQAALAAHFRRAAIRLVNAGVSGEAYSAMLNRLDRDVIAVHPDLVIWQLGTNAVIREVGVSQDEPAILKGVERLKAAGVDVILMNPQYAPLVVRDPDTPAMLKLLDDVGREERVPVFERFDAMREWIAEQQVPLSSFVSVDGLHMSDLAHRCVGVLLAQCVIDDVERGPATVEAAQDATR